MTERDLIILLVGGVIGYCFCFVVEIRRMLNEDEPAAESEPPAHHRAERDPADWWKEVE